MNLEIEKPKKICAETLKKEFKTFVSFCGHPKSTEKIILNFSDESEKEKAVKYLENIEEHMKYSDYKQRRKVAYAEAGLTMEEWQHLEIEGDEKGKQSFRSKRDAIKKEFPKC